MTKSETRDSSQGGRNIKRMLTTNANSIVTSLTTQWPAWTDLDWDNRTENITGTSDGGHVNATSSSPTPTVATSGPSMLFRFLCESGIAIPVSLLGVAGNVLAILVLCRQKQRQSTTLILQGLAVTDTLVLLATLLLRSLRYLHYYLHWAWLGPYMAAYKYIFYCLFPLVYFLRLIDTWLIVLLTIDRYIAVRHPLHAQRLCTYPRAAKNIVALFLIAFFFSIPRFFEYELTTENSFGFKASIFAKNHNYTITYRIIIFFIFMYLVPMTLLIVLNTQLLKTLRTAEIYRAQITERSSSSRSRSITAVVVTVTLVAIVCNVTAMVTHLLWSLHVAFPHLSHLDLPRRYLALISNIFITLNSAINFGIYCLCSRNFRTGLRRLVWCYADKGGLTRGGSSMRTTGTYISLTHSSTIRKKSSSASNTVGYLPNKLLYA